MAIFIAAFFVLMVIYGLVIDRYRKDWNSIPLNKNSLFTPTTTITVIIAARNEEHNLPALIAGLSQQTYPLSLFEIIIVNDHSTDRTAVIAEQLAASLPNLKLISTDRGERRTGHKKNAIQTGIKAASGVLIVTTDADCTFEDRWLETIAQVYESTGAKMIAAPVKLEGKRSFLYYFQALDFLTLQGITGAAVFHHRHILCNGANLAYEKSVFEAVNGFSGNDHLASGDDMLLMQKFWEIYPTQIHYLKSRDAIVHTAAAGSWKTFFNQRIRWASKSDAYTDRKLFRLMLLVYAVNCSFAVLIVFTWWKSMAAFFLLLFLAAKIMIEFPLVQTTAIFFGQQRLLKFFPFMQPVHIFYTIIAGWLGKFGRFEWKGRVLKS